MDVGEVVRALQEHDAKIKPAANDKSPAENPKKQGFQFTLTTPGRLVGPEVFLGIIVKTDGRGRIVRLKDVAQGRAWAIASQGRAFHGSKPAVLLAFYPLAGRPSGPRQRVA